MKRPVPNAEATAIARSRPKGVTRSRGRWQAQIAVNGNTVFLGRFDSEAEAAAAYAEAWGRGVAVRLPKDRGFSESDMAKLDRGGPVPGHRPVLGPCWVWTGYVGADGYGRHSTVSGGKRSPRLVHVLVYEAARGTVPDGLELDHLCRNRACAKARPLRPDGTPDPTDHLEAVTKAENIRRGESGAHSRSKTHCPDGHPYDETNTYWNGRVRRCRTCRLRPSHKARR